MKLSAHEFNMNDTQERFLVKLAMNYCTDVSGDLRLATMNGGGDQGMEIYYMCVRFLSQSLCSHACVALP